MRSELGRLPLLPIPTPATQDSVRGRDLPFSHRLRLAAAFAFPSRPGIETQEKGQTGTATGTRAPGKPPVAKPERHVASAKATSDKKTTPAKKPAKAAKAAKPAKTAKPAKRESGARQGSKTEKVLDLLKRPKDATLKELLKARPRRFS